MPTKELPKLLYHTFAGWQALEIKGPDAKNFLHRMTTVDFSDFAVGGHAMGALLQATGKIILFFHMLRAADTEFLLLVPDAEEAFEALEKFHFMEKLAIEPRRDTFIFMRIAGSGADPGVGLMLAPLGARVFELNQWTKPVWEERFAFDLGAVVPGDELGAASGALAKAGAAELDPASRESFRVYFGEPAVPNEINATVMPLEAGIEEAVHENKGCYPGQEVIERIRAMGQVPRKLACVRGTGAPARYNEQGSAPAQTISIMGRFEGDSPVEAGTLTSAATDPTDSSKWVGMALLKKNFLKGSPTFSVDGKPIQVRVK